MWQISHCLIDEGQQLLESQVLYLMSRLRTDADMKSVMRITCNPDKKSFLRKWIDWYLIPGTGLPDPEKCGVIRWFTMQDSQMVWADSKQELIDKIGPNCKPLSFTFINANVYDNPVLMKRQPEYVSWLEGLPRVEKERLLYGNWDATESTSGFWKKEWMNSVDYADPRPSKRVRAWDIAGTLPSESNRDPDYTASVLMSKSKSNMYRIEDVDRFRDRFNGVEEKIFATAARDGFGTTIIIPCDPGAAAKAYSMDLVKRLTEAGYHARLKSSNNSKITRFAPFSAISEAGFVECVKAPWNEYYFEELESFSGDGKTHDDMVDATADAFWALKSSTQLPSFTLPDLVGERHFAF